MFDRLYPFGISVLILVLDQLTKWIIKTRVTAWETLTVIPGLFNIVHAENPGVAFGFLADSSSQWRNILLIALSVGVMIFISTLLLKPGAAQSPLLKIGLAFVLGGAVGNLYDRVVNGTVTDFVEVYAGTHYFPAFNVADSAITIGAALLLIDMWRGRDRSQEQIVPAGHKN